MEIDYELVLSFVGVVFIGAGISWWGLSDLKNKRYVQDIATSKIATGAVGSFVEIKGKILYEPDKLVTAPLCEVQCVFYHLEIWVENGSWFEQTENFYSTESFYVDGGNNTRALVYPEEAELILKGRSTEIKNIKNISASLRALLENKAKGILLKLEKSRILGIVHRESCLTEKYLLPNDNFYIMGFAYPDVDAQNTTKMIFRAKEEGCPFIISNMKETQLTFHLNWRSFLKITGGVIVAIYGFFSILSELKYLN